MLYVNVCISSGGARTDQTAGDVVSIVMLYVNVCISSGGARTDQSAGNVVSIMMLYVNVCISSGGARTDQSAGDVVSRMMLYVNVCISSGGARTDQSAGDTTSTTATTADRKWTPGDGGSVEGRTGPNVGIVPDNQQLFVGNLPHNVDDEELVKFFASESLHFISS